MQKLTVEQWQLIEELNEKLPSHYTLQDILNRNDLNPHTEGTIPIESVEFNIEGILKYAYECTGETMEFKGTIKETMCELVGEDVFNNDEDEDIEMVKIKNIWSKHEIRELAKFFLGERSETHLDEVTATANREVTIEEIINYIRDLDVMSDFKYRQTILEY